MSSNTFQNVGVSLKSVKKQKQCLAIKVTLMKKSPLALDFNKSISKAKKKNIYKP